MKFVVMFEDNAGVGDEIRSRYMQDHLAFLEQHSELIEAAGPVYQSDGSGAGGVWIVEADGADTVRNLVEADPFWPTGLRKSVEVLAWKQVFAGGKRLVKPAR